MIIKNIALIIFWLFIIPIVLGYGLLRFDFKNKNRKLPFALLLGYLIEWLVFQSLAIPFTYYHTSFSFLKDVWVAIIGVLSAISLIINIKEIKTIIIENIEELKKLPKILSIVLIIVISVQCYLAFSLMYTDDDDSNFAAKATIAVDTDTLFIYNDSGGEYTKLPERHFLSQFPHWTGVISVLVDLRPAVVMHTVFPVVFIILAYNLYYLIGLALFENDHKKACIFLLMTILACTFSDYGRNTAAKRLYTRAWQGKTLIANVFIPMIFYLYLEFLGKKDDAFYWVCLLMLLWAGCLPSTMGLFLLPIMAGVLTLIYMIKDKKLSYIFKYILCCIPTMSYIVAYLIIFEKFI